MATSLRPLQTALFAKLNAVPALAGRVYDKVPEPAPYPYVNFGSISEVPDDQHDAQGISAVVVLHTWTKSQGSGQAYDMAAAVDTALDRVPLTIPGFQAVFIKSLGRQTIEDPDPDICHINAEFQVDMTKE
jgi:hypothetical protein